MASLEKTTTIDAKGNTSTKVKETTALDKATMAAGSSGNGEQFQAGISPDSQEAGALLWDDGFSSALVAEQGEVESPDDRVVFSMLAANIDFHKLMAHTALLQDLKSQLQQIVADETGVQ